MSFAIDNQRLAVFNRRCGGRYGVARMPALRETVYPSGSHNVLFSPVRSDEQAEALPEAYEPIEVNEFGEIDLLATVEDEIITRLASSGA